MIGGEGLTVTRDFEMLRGPGTQKGYIDSRPQKSPPACYSARGMRAQRRNESCAAAWGTTRAPTLMPPLLVIIGGYPGSGKTEVSKLLAHRLEWPLLDKDTLTRPLSEALLEKLGETEGDRESDAYLNEVRPLEYISLLNVAYEIVDCGAPVVATAPFIEQVKDGAWLRRVETECRIRGATLLAIWVSSDLASMRRRLLKRGAARDQAKLADWDRYTKSIEYGRDPVFRGEIVDNRGDAREDLSLQVDRLEAKIRQVIRNV